MNGIDYESVRKNTLRLCTRRTSQTICSFASVRSQDVLGRPAVPCTWKVLMGWILRLQNFSAMLYISVIVLTRRIYVGFLLYVIFWMSYAMLVEAEFLNELLHNIF